MADRVKAHRRVPGSGKALEHRNRLLGRPAQVRHPQHDVTADLISGLDEHHRDAVHDLLDRRHDPHYRLAHRPDSR